MTEEEVILWEAIRDRQLAGLKFRAQHPVSRSVLDFYCAEVRLVVEIDGGSHLDRAERDKARTALLAAYNYHVIRFSNDEVAGNLPSVLNWITRMAERLRDSPSPNFGRGG